MKLNGVALVQGTDYNTTTANTVGGLSALSAGQVVEIVVYERFVLGDTVSKADGGTFLGNVGFNGTTTGLDLNGTELILDADADTSITADTDDQIDFKTGGTDAMHIDGTGRVQIGTSTAKNDALLTIRDSGTANPMARIAFDSGDAGVTNGVNIGYTAATFAPDFEIANKDSGIIRFKTNDTERMRIDATNTTVSVGTTDINLHNSNTAGINLGGNGNLGQIIASCDGNRPLILHRASNDGQLVEFGCQTSTTGEIGSRGNNIYIAGANAGIKFGNNSAFVPTDSSGNNSDNTRDVGSSSVRFDDIFATNSSIQTSDQNEKEQIASLTTAEITAAKAISKLFKTFKWQDKVAAKGDAARTHAGVIAQEVQTAMTDAGLDAADYAFWCSDTWWEANGETYDTADEAPEGATQRTRLGIRYAELLAFIGAATEQRLADIETRLTALEA